MPLYTDLKYLKLLPLKGYKETGKETIVANFRCPVCGDSKISETKKRGWALKHKGKIFIKCFNCNYNKPINILLRDYFKHLYDDYKKESFADKLNIKDNKKREEILLGSTEKKIEKEYEKLDLKSVNMLEDNHFAKKYLIKRKIPKKYYSILYYVDHFQKWVNTKIPDKFEKIIKKDPRIVIPLFTPYRKIFGVQGRALYKTNTKYITIKFNETYNKIFGLERIERNKTIYVTEGPLDSLFISNSIALTGGINNLDQQLRDINIHKENYVLVYDNTPRDKQMKGFMTQALKNGYTVVIWPGGIKFKDLNDMIVGGYTKKMILNIIKKNSFSGLSGIAKLKFWSK